MIAWLEEPKTSNFDAAHSFLILAVGHDYADRLIKQLKEAKVEDFAAKDILRAANLQALPRNTEHVQKNMDKMRNGHEIGPVMLARVKDRPLIVADGMHRVSAAWYLDEDTKVKAIVGEIE